MDYDEPHGATVKIALLRVKARDQNRRMGSLFLNPGGPGGSGKGLAVRSRAWLSAEIQNRFDLVGMDPRGTNDSTRLECYRTATEQGRDTSVLSMVFPDSPDEQRRYLTAAGGLAGKCSTRGLPLAASMTTAEVARDLDVLRRAVGDAKLTYLGFSYGTYLGQVYANMFPDRFRAIAIDGVINPLEWRGTPTTASIPPSQRMNSAPATARAMWNILERCRLAGTAACGLATPHTTFDAVLRRLRQRPVTLVDGSGGKTVMTYQKAVQALVLNLYEPEGVTEVPAMVKYLDEATRAPHRAASHPVPAFRSAATALARTASQLDNPYELNAAVSCSDVLAPWDAQRWSQLAASEEARVPAFGRYWLWQSAFCAGKSWTAHDEDTYSGPFDRWTDSPVLAVGNYYDPSTAFEAALAVRRLIPNSRLIRSYSWGHTAYARSRCTTSAMDTYLLTGRVPDKDLSCAGDWSPFR